MKNKTKNELNCQLMYGNVKPTKAFFKTLFFNAISSNQNLSAFLGSFSKTCVNNHKTAAVGTLTSRDSSCTHTIFVPLAFYLFF